MTELAKLFKTDVQPFEVKVVPLNQCYQCTINEAFTDVAQFAPLVDYLNNAVQGDIAHIRLSTIGGALHSIIPVIEAMNNTEAHIAMHVESDTASAGTILMMLADDVYINPYSSIMIHTANYGYYGHAGNMDAYVKHSTTATTKIINDMYKDFLTPEEIRRVQDGLEIHLTPEDCYERFKRRNEARAKAMKPAKKPRAKKAKTTQYNPETGAVE